MLRPKFRIRKVFHQTSSDLSSPVSSWKMAVHCPIITSKKNQLFIWFSVFEGVCKYSSRPLPAKQSLLKLRPPIPSKTSRPKFRTKREFLQISNV